MKRFVRRPMQGDIVLIRYPAGFTRTCIVEECDAEFRVSGAEIHAGLSVGLVVVREVAHVFGLPPNASFPGWEWPPKTATEDGRWF